MPGANVNVETAAPELLFHNDIPVLRTSLARHGLVDLSVPPTPRTLRVEPRSSEDLTAADEEEDGWVRAGDTEEWCRDSSGSGEGVERQDKHWHAMLGVNSVMVGHVRAAQEIRQALLSSPAYQRHPLNAREASDMGAAGGARQSRAEFLQASTPTGGRGSGGAAAAAARRSWGGNIAHTAATAALNAARAGRARAAGGAARKTGGGPGPEERPAVSAWPRVSMSAVLDIAVNLFGPGSGGSGGGDDGRRSSAGNGAKRGAGSVGRGGPGGYDDGLMTFTIDVPTGGSMSLGITVKELGGGAVFVEDLRKLPGQPPGAAEQAGVAVGDVIHGINYEPLERGLRHTSALLAKAITLAGFVKLQISRIVNPSTRRNLLPGRDCPIVTELMWRTAQLRKAGVLTSGERYTIAGLVLRRMAWEEGTTMGPPEPPRAPAHLSVLTAAPVPSLLKSAASAQLDSLVLQVKGLREAIYVRCLRAQFTVEPVKLSSVWGPPAAGEAAGSAAAPAPGSRVTVLYVLRAEDVATGREWLVFPRYSDFSEIHQELLVLWPPIADLPFPPKRPVSTLLQGEPGVGAGVIEERVVGLEAFLHGALALLGTYASLDPRCAGGLRLVQDFLGMPKGLARAEAALSPMLCDQKRGELLLYKLLNQTDSPAARMKDFLMRDFDNELLIATDVESLMRATSSRLGSLQEFVLEQHGEKLSSFMETSHVNATSEAKDAATRKAVRRQVELSLYLPLRRCLWKELMLRLKGDASKLKRAIKALRRSPPSAFGLESPDILGNEEWGPAKKAMGQATRTALPTDQIDGLRRAAQHIITLHASLQSTPSVDAAGGGDDDCKMGNANEKPGREDAGVAAARWGRGEEGEGGGRLVGGGTEDTAVVHVVKDAVFAKDGFPFCQNGDSGRRESDDGSGLTGAVSSSASPSEDAAQGAGDDTINNDHDDDANYGCSLGATRATSRSSDERRHALPLSPQQVQAGGEVEGPFEAAATAAARATRAADICEQPPGEGRGASGEEGLFTRASSVSGSRSWRASSRGMDISPLPGASRSSSWDSVDSELSTGGSGDRVGGTTRGGDQRAGPGARGESGLVANGVGRTGEVEPDVEETGGVAATAQPEEIMSADDFLPLFSLVLVHSAPLDLLLPQTSLTHLMGESLSEAGYLVATLEASVSYITQIYSSSCADEQQEPP